MSIVGGIQPRTFRRLMTAEFFENGSVARLLLAMPPIAPKRWTDAVIAPDVETAYGKAMESMFQLQPSAGPGGESYPATVTLGPDALDIWRAWYDTQAQRQYEAADTDWGAALAKLEGAAARLALIHHQIRQAAGEDVDPWRCGESSMVAGIALADWFANEAQRVYGVLGESDEDRAQRMLIEFIRRKGGRVTPRDLMRGGPCYATRDEAELALQSLVGLGLGSWSVATAGEQGGRPSDVFELMQNDNTPAFSGESEVVSVSVTPEPGGNGQAVDEYEAMEREGILADRGAA